MGVPWQAGTTQRRVPSEVRGASGAVRGAASGIEGGHWLQSPIIISHTDDRRLYQMSLDARALSGCGPHLAGHPLPWIAPQSVPRHHCCAHRRGLGPCDAFTPVSDDVMDARVRGVVRRSGQWHVAGTLASVVSAIDGTYVLSLASVMCLPSAKPRFTASRRTGHALAVSNDTYGPRASVAQRSSTVGRRWRERAGFCWKRLGGGPPT